MNINKKNTRKIRNLKDRTRNSRNTRNTRNTRNSRNTRNRKKIGGTLKSNCLAFTGSKKCGKEGCVYLDDEKYATKKQWKTYNELPSYFLSIEGQQNSKPFAPEIISNDIKLCNLISLQGSEDKAPCFVKRYRNTRTGEKILYEEEKRDSWCRNYGVKNQCVVDQDMYNNFKNNVSKVSFNGKTNKNIKLPEVDDMIDGDIYSVDDEGLGDLYDKIEIDDSFTNLNPIFLSSIKMDRIKGITIAELISEMYNIFGEEKTMSVAEEWEKEKEKVINNVIKKGYKSPDFNEQNIMIDVDDDNLCLWIDDLLSKGELVTPEKIKNKFGKEDILKIVDWGLLKKIKPITNNQIKDKLTKKEI